MDVVKIRAVFDDSDGGNRFLYLVSRLGGVSRLINMGKFPEEDFGIGVFEKFADKQYYIHVVDIPQPGFSSRRPWVLDIAERLRDQDGRWAFVRINFTTDTIGIGFQNAEDAVKFRLKYS